MSNKLNHQYFYKSKKKNIFNNFLKKFANQNYSIKKILKLFYLSNNNKNF